MLVHGATRSGEGHPTNFRFDTCCSRSFCRSRLCCVKSSIWCRSGDLYTGSGGLRGLCDPSDCPCRKPWARVLPYRQRGALDMERGRGPAVSKSTVRNTEPGASPPDKGDVQKEKMTPCRACAGREIQQPRCHRPLAGPTRRTMRGPHHITGRWAP